MRPDPLRVVVHAIFKTDITPPLIQDLKDHLAKTFAKQGLLFEDFCIDLGTAKQRPEDYLAIELLRRGYADALIVTRTPMFGQTDARDLLQRLCLPDDKPLALWTAEQLRELGLLPVQKPDADAGQRAMALRAEGLPLRDIGMRLSGEGFRTPRGGRWSAQAVGRLLNARAPRRTARRHRADDSARI